MSTTEALITVAGGFHVGDRVRSNMSGIESTVIPPPPGRSQDVVWTDHYFGDPTFLRVGGTSLVSCPHTAEADEEAAEVIDLPGGFHVGDTVQYKRPGATQVQRVLAGAHETNPHGVRYADGGWDVVGALELVTCPHTKPDENPPLEVLAGGFHIGDTVQYNSAAVAPGAIAGVVAGPGPRANSVLYAGGGFDYLNVLELRACPHAKPVTPAPEGYIPWGPHHPDWDPFWDKADKAAEEAHFCDEYARIVGEIGGRPRSTHEEITLEVTIHLTATVPRGGTIGPANMLTVPAGASLTVQNFRERKRTPVRE